MSGLAPLPTYLYPLPQPQPGTEARLSEVDVLTSVLEHLRAVTVPHAFASASASSPQLSARLFGYAEAWWLVVAEKLGKEEEASKEGLTGPRR